MRSNEGNVLRVLQGDSKCKCLQCATQAQWARRTACWRRKKQSARECGRRQAEVLSEGEVLSVFEGTGVTDAAAEF